MPVPSERLLHRDLSRKVIGAFLEVYYELGFGFLESVYEAAMCEVLSASGLAFERQAALYVHFRGTPVGLFRADLLIERAIVVELKACKGLESAHQAQLLNCLKATELEVGLLFNFGPKPQFKRMAFSHEPNNFRVLPRISAADFRFTEPQ